MGIISSHDEVSSGGQQVADKAAELELALRARTFADDATRGWDSSPIMYGYNDNTATDEYGHYYSVSKTDSESAAWNKFYNAYRRNNAQVIAELFTDVPGLFDQLATMPDPGALASMADSLVPALTALGGPSGQDDFTDGSRYAPHEAYDQIPSIATGMDGWDGLAARAFTGWANGTERRVANEFNAVAALRGMVLAERDLWTKAREDAVTFVNNTYTKLEDLYASNPSDLTWPLAILGAVVGVAAVPATGGASVALAVVSGAVALGSTAVGSASSPTPTPSSGNSASVTISGATPLDVIESFRTSLTSFKDWLVAEEAKVYAAIDEVNGALGTTPGRPGAQGQTTSTEYVMAEPTLNTSTPDNVYDDDHFGTVEA